MRNKPKDQFYYRSYKRERNGFELKERGEKRGKQKKKERKENKETWRYFCPATPYALCEQRSQSKKCRIVE